MQFLQLMTNNNSNYKKMRSKILTWAPFVQKHEKKKKKKKDSDMRNWCYSALYFSGEFLTTVYTTFKNFPISPLIEKHCMQCNAYTLKLTCTVNLSRVSHFTIQVTLLLNNTKFFNVTLNILLNSIESSSQVTNKVAATLLLKAILTENINCQNINWKY